MNAAEIEAAFERGVREVYGASRGDERFIHVADVKGCNLATRARMLGKPMLPFSVAKLVQFQFGHAGEAIFTNSIKAALAVDGYSVETDVLLWMQWRDEIPVGGKLLRADYDAGLLFSSPFDVSLDPSKTIVGHADFLASHPENPSILGEFKTVDRAFTNDVRWDYAIQTRMYALMAHAVGSQVVGVIDRRKGDYRFYDVSLTESDICELRTLCERALAMYSFDPPFEAEPPQPWMCKTCDYGACSRNKNPERYALQEAF